MITACDIRLATESAVFCVKASLAVWLTRLPFATCCTTCTQAVHTRLQACFSVATPARLGLLALPAS